MKNILNFLRPRKKLHIFYKHIHSGVGKNRPDWFSHEICFINLLRSLDQKNLELDVDLTVLFDGTPESYEENFISRYYRDGACNFGGNNFKFNLEIFKGGSQRLAGLHLLNKVRTMNYSLNDYVYILENDYLHDYSWVRHLNQLLSSDIPVDYISLYDHPDKYPYTKGFHESHVNLQSKIYVAGDRHWRSIPSTCYSFIVSIEKFNEDLEILSSDRMDHQVFDELAKKERLLLSPIPSLATHCMVNLLSPGIDWDQFLLPPMASRLREGRHE
ncbi:hypothetical protein [Polynucleobacter sphagniphilus]|uniref:hypothetical protein n=1 Tax=Polynucleobacter sphagniphilus TaxID=1743169 RepID=UPI00096B94A2|nr:hypothetical protein [Polynucleobacter sphagniphilus]OLY96017.1 hypothetical protein BOQ04_07105 [Polynucleobacter sphagniphilus]